MEKYKLDLYIDKNKKYIGGTVKIFGKFDEALELDAVDMTIKKVLVDGAAAEFKYEKNILSIPAAGAKEIEIEYDGELNENMQGAYLSTYEYEGRTETIVATQFESHYAREAFPCVDRPDAKAVFELSITVPENSDDLILSNMPVETVVKNTTVFQPTPRMSTYLLAFVIGKFHGKSVVNKHGTKITTYAALNQELDAVDFANEVAARSLEFYDDNFGVKYPLEKLDQVALPDFEAGAMENWGLVTYRESMMLASRAATLGTKKSVALTVAHELSHQWFGDLVTMKWWDDLWLNESFASVMEYFAVDAIYPEFKIFEGFFVGDALSALMRDGYTDVQSVHQDVSDPAEIATLFDGAIVYSKGARLMLMLIRAMGWEDFCAGCREYFEKYQYNNTVGDDLWEVLSRHAKFNVGEMMHAFIDRPGYPVIESSGGKFERFSQRRFLLDAEEMPESDWPVPKITEDMSGHYVLNLTAAEFEERLSRFDELNLEEKLRLLIDRSLLARTKLASSADLIPLIKKFRKENSAAVWSIISTIVSQLKIFFKYDSAEEKAFKKFVGELVAEKLEEVGIETRKDDDENILRLRSILLGLDYYAENEKNLRTLAEMYDHNYEKLDSERRDDILDAKIYFEPEMAREFLEDYNETNDPEIKYDLLFAATLARDEKVLKELVGFLDRWDVVKPQDQIYLYAYLYRNRKASGMTFSWLKKNWAKVAEMMGDKSLDHYPRLMANTIRTEEEFREWKEFFGPMRDNLAIRRAVVIGEKEIAARLELIKNDREAVMKELES